MVKKGSILLTDEWKAYIGLEAYYIHSIVNHGAGQYMNRDAIQILRTGLEIEILLNF